MDRGVLLLLLGGQLAFALPKPGHHCIAWAEFLAKNDLVWADGIQDTWGESAFVANGLTGASIYRMPVDDWILHWELGRWQSMPSALAAYSYTGARPLEACGLRLNLGKDHAGSNDGRSV